MTHTYKGYTITVHPDKGHGVTAVIEGPGHICWVRESGDMRAVVAATLRIDQLIAQHSAPIAQRRTQRAAL